MSDDELQKNIFCIGKTWKKGQKKLSQKKNIIIHIIYPLYGKDFLGPVAFKPIEDQDHQYLAYNQTLCCGYLKESFHWEGSFE